MIELIKKKTIDEWFLAGIGECNVKVLNGLEINSCNYGNKE